MDLIWIIYLIDVFTDNNGMETLASFLVLSIFIGCLMRAFLDPEGCNRSDYKVGVQLTTKYSTIPAVIMVVFLFLTPSKDTAYKMLAAYGVTEAYTAAADSEKVQALAGKSLSVLEKAMDDYLVEEK